MEFLKKWYILAAVVWFSLFASLGGRTPVGWALYGAGQALGSAKSAQGGAQSSLDDTAEQARAELERAIEEHGQ